MLKALRTRKKIALGLLAGAWVAVGVALVGAIITPTDYCVELPRPAGETTTIAALSAGTAIWLAAMLFALDDLMLIAVGCAALAAGGGVAIFAAHQAAAWGCG